MKVLVTGGTGFLGEHLVRQLLESGEHEPIVLARSTSPVLTELGVTQVRGSVSEGPELEDCLAGCEGVFHLAGVVSLAGSVDAPRGRHVLSRGAQPARGSQLPTLG